jgi:hypothetical protein
MALTDAFGVACKYLGIGASVYWDKEKGKYTEGDEDDKKSKNQEKPSNAPKTHDTTKVDKQHDKKQESVFKPISRTEMVQQYGERNVEQFISWCEDKLQVPYAEWDEECDAQVRAKLLERKKKREQAEQEERKRQETLGQLEDLPFDVGGR